MGDRINYPPLEGLQFQTATFATLAAGALDTINITNPQGAPKLVGLYFNPAIDIRVTIRNQNQQREFLQGFSTKIGNVGFIPLSQYVGETGRLIITALNQETSAQTPAFSLVFVANDPSKTSG